jgi:hypothetical protein
MNRIVCLVGIFLSATVANAGEGTLPAPRVIGLKNPQGIVVGGDGRVYVSVAGEKKKRTQLVLRVILSTKRAASPFFFGDAVTQSRNDRRSLSRKLSFGFNLGAK